MFDPVPEPVPDPEVEAVLTEALRGASGSLSRSVACFMATAVARHLVDQLALAGLAVVRYPQGKQTP
jgi:hypothetical protein